MNVSKNFPYKATKSSLKTKHNDITNITPTEDINDECTTLTGKLLSEVMYLKLTATIVKYKTRAQITINLVLLGSNINCLTVSIIDSIEMGKYPHKPFLPTILQQIKIGNNDITTVPAVGINLSIQDIIEAPSINNTV